jgi:hypothetical protein
MFPKTLTVVHFLLVMIGVAVVYGFYYTMNILNRIENQLKTLNASLAIVAAAALRPEAERAAEASKIWKREE